MKISRLTWIALTLISIAALAVVLDYVQRHRNNTDLTGRFVLGPVDLNRAGIVLIETHEGQVTFERTPFGWIVQEQDRFAADVEKLRALLSRLSALPLAMRVPIRPEKLGDLSLLQKVENNWNFEPGRTAAVLSVVKPIELRHRMLYQVLIGKRHPEGHGTYIRYPSSNNVYLVADHVELDGHADRWIDRRVFTPEALDELQRISVQSGGRSGVRLTRAGPQAPWRLAGLRRPTPAGPVSELIGSLAELRVESISRRGTAAGGGISPALELGFFDGRVVTLTLQPNASGGNGLRHGRLAAHLTGPGADEDHLELRWAVERFNHRFATRVVSLDGTQVQSLLRPRSAFLLRP